MMYRPGDLHKFLSQLGTGPNKSLSQNFLIDGNIIRKIAALAEVSVEDRIIEIGPGPGALTQELLATGASVIAVEKDRVLADHLSRLNGNLTVAHQDILDFDFSPYQGAKVIANLPYHITTPVVTLLCKNHAYIKMVVVMVQHEVGLKMIAKPGSKEYGTFTLLLDYHARAEYAFKVGRSCFYPKPNVDSAVVKLTLRTPPQISDSERCLSQIRLAFQNRRKMLRRTWGDVYGAENVSSALLAQGLMETSRPEELSLDQFIKLFERLNGV